MNLRPPEPPAKRLLDVVEALDGGKDSPHNFEPWKQMVEERSGSFPTRVQWFLLNKLFQMRPAKIARMEGVKYPSEVRGLYYPGFQSVKLWGNRLFREGPGRVHIYVAKLVLIP